MNAFVRRLAVLSILWSICELLMPEGKHQQMVRMTVSVLIMTSLLSSLSEWTAQTAETPAWAQQVLQAGEESYQRTVLGALANQVENFCVRQAYKAGYEAQAAVWLDAEGELQHIEIRLSAKDTPLLSPLELVQHLAHQLQTQEECIRLEET